MGHFVSQNKLALRAGFGLRALRMEAPCLHDTTYASNCCERSLHRLPFVVRCLVQKPASLRNRPAPS